MLCDKTEANGNSLIAAMDDFARGLLGQAKSSESFAYKIAAFEKIGRWIAIKHRLGDGGNDSNEESRRREKSQAWKGKGRS